MNATRKYHGWIYIERSTGMKDFIQGYHVEPSGRKTYSKGDYGVAGADDAVRLFEETLGLGPVKLEVTPVGLRVYTED